MWLGIVILCRECMCTVYTVYREYNAVKCTEYIVGDLKYIASRMVGTWNEVWFIRTE